MNKFRKLDIFHLKIIGMVTMLIDHIGAILFPEVLILRTIGRISFVLFAFTTVEAMRYSKHRERYILILLGMEILLSLLNYIFMHEYNSTVFAILGLSTLTIYLLEKKKLAFKLCAIFPIMYVIFSTFNFTFFKVEYGIYGLILILGFYFARIILIKYSKNNQLIADSNTFINSDYFHNTYLIICAIIIISLSLISFIFSNYLSELFPSDYFDYTLQSQAIIACIFILLYTGKRGYDSKPYRIFCYSFYPVHLLILYLISLV